GSGVRFPHFPCNRFLAQPLLPRLDFPRSLHVTANAHLALARAIVVGRRFPFPTLWPPMATETGNAAIGPTLLGIGQTMFQSPPMPQKTFSGPSAGAAKKREIEFPPTQVEQTREGRSYPGQTASKYCAHP